jgi:hypothetical protein
MFNSTCYGRPTDLNMFKGGSVKTVRIALAGASLWSAALVVAALTLPAYSGSTASTDPTGAVTTSSSTATLVEANGTWGLVVASIPLAACLVVVALLLGPGGRPAHIVAAVVVALLGILTVLSLLSIGLFLVPVVGALAVAVLGALGALGAVPAEEAP